MKRRDFMIGTAAAMAWSESVKAQSIPKQPTIGVLTLADPNAPPNRALLEGLRDFGWIEGENVRVVFRVAATIDQLPALAAELVQMRVDVIFAAASPQVEAARRATTSIPIVFAAHADPIGLGHVASLSRPGGNITGMSQLITELAGKGLEILKEALPSTKRFGVLWNPGTPSHAQAIEAARVAAEKLGIELILSPATVEADLDGAISTLKRSDCRGALVIASPLVFVERAKIAELFLKHRLASIFSNQDNAVAGGLMSYGVDLVALYRQTANYVDKILRGAHPADLPVEQATKFDLVLNLKVAKALGFEFPAVLLLRADRVIE